MSNANHNVEVEVCIDSTDERAVREAVAAAYAGGAVRVELCRAMDQQGLTPETAHLRAARAAFGKRPGLMVMVRPRGGNFCYSNDERAAMAASIHAAAAAGADGVVLGVLHEDRRIDVPALQTLVETAHALGLTVTFHRAFDATPDPLEAIGVLVGVGVDRVLTSGVPWGAAGTALDGRSVLAAVIRAAGQQVEVIVGGGVTAHNVGSLLNALPLSEGRVSVHAYSGAQEGGRTTEQAVRALVAAAQSIVVS